MSEKKNTYMAYLLRLWREDETTSWRVMLENIQTRERTGFSNLAKLAAFLEETTGPPTLPEQPEDNQQKKEENM